MARWAVALGNPGDSNTLLSKGSRGTVFRNSANPLVFRDREGAEAFLAEAQRYLPQETCRVVDLDDGGSAGTSAQGGHQDGSQARHSGTGAQ